MYSYNFMLISKQPEDCDIFLQTFRWLLTEHTIIILRFLKKNCNLLLILGWRKSCNSIFIKHFYNFDSKLLARLNHEGTYIEVQPWTN
jgi:hypothetical protein